MRESRLGGLDLEDVQASGIRPRLSGSGAPISSAASGWVSRAVWMRRSCCRWTSLIATSSCSAREPVPGGDSRSPSSRRDGRSRLAVVIEAEKPAHTTYELELIGPRFRLGVQSTVGIDTILGDARPHGCSGGGGDPHAAPGAPRRGRLGYDTVLSPAEPVDTLVRLGPRDRLGIEARQL